MNTRNREHLVIAPFFRIETPPLGAACLQSYLKQFEIAIDFTDYRLRKNTVDITSANVGYRYNYAADLQDLPLIQTIAGNYLSNKPLLSNMDESVRNYIESRPLSYFMIKEDINDVYSLFQQDLNRLSTYSLVGFTTYITNIFATVLCACMLKQKKPDIIIVFGGPQTSESVLTSELVLRLGIVDVVAIGDGEEVFRRIIEADRAKAELAVEGTMTFDHNTQTLLKKTAPMLNIQNLPCPDFSGIQLARYSMSPNNLPLYTSRGCPYKCEFCNDNTLWDKYRRLKVERVIDWMQQLHHKYGAVRFFMADSLLNTSQKWTEEFADTLLSKGLNYQWYGMFRVDNIDLPFAKKLKRSGLCRALIGAEAYSEETLARMKKQATPDDNARATEAFCTAGIPLEISNVIGFPGESEKDFQAKLQFYFDLSKKHSGMFIVNAETYRFVPGSGIYKQPDKFNIEIINWDQKTIDAIPQISSVVAKMPMAIKSQPDAGVIMRWKSIIGSHFQSDQYSRLNYSNKMNEGLLKILLQDLNNNSVVKFNRFSLNEAIPNKVFQINFGQRAKCLLSLQEADMYKAMQKTKSIGQALSHLQKTRDDISIDNIKDLLNKLIAAGVQPNIINPLPNQLAKERPKQESNQTESIH